MEIFKRNSFKAFQALQRILYIRNAALQNIFNQRNSNWGHILQTLRYHTFLKLAQNQYIP
jgi:hypothetical protein